MSDATGLDVGIHADIPETAYHADPAAEPSASASILRTVHDASPEHAWTDHPRLNPNWQHDAPSDAQAAGTIIHWHILGGGPRPYRPLDFDSFRTDKAKAAKAATIAAGLIPILEGKLDELLLVANAIRDRIEREQPEVRAALDDAATLKEATLIWRERNALCRCRVDVLPPARFGFALDLKTTGRSAEPEKWGRTLVNEHLFQAALYPRAIEALRGDRPEFWFLVCETDPPYGVSLHAMDPPLAALADDKLNAALRKWRECLAMNHWPGYARQVHYQEAPPWEVARQRGREFRESAETPGETYARLYEKVGGPLG